MKVGKRRIGEWKLVKKNMNLAKKISFLIKRPLLIIVSDGSEKIAFRVLSFLRETKRAGRAKFFSVLKDEILIIDFDLEQDFDFLIKNSKKTILVVNEVAAKIKIIELTRKLRERDVLVFNFDEEETREIQSMNKGKSLSVGFLRTPDLSISDFNVNQGETNFKIDFQGNIVPIWLKGEWTKKKVTVLSLIIICAFEFGLNLVEISQQLKKFSLE